MGVLDPEVPICSLKWVQKLPLRCAEPKLKAQFWRLSVKVILEQMHKPTSSPPQSGSRRPLDLARVLLVHGDLAPRLALQTILQAGGYSVDVAATPSEALAKLDESKYELVLSDTDFGSRPAGRNVLAYARVKEYRPATALITSYEAPFKYRTALRRRQISIGTENLASLLSGVAELIGIRASRRYRPLRPAY
jgi:CheY-like chemotaxis protein